MNCKHCNAELEEGMNFCPACGAAQKEPGEPVIETPVEETPAKTGLGAGKIALLVALAVAAIAVVIALIVGGSSGKTPAETTVPVETTAPTVPVETVMATIPADGDPNTVACKGTYTASDEEVAAAADTVVATMGDAKLTNAELQVYYWSEVYGFLNQYGIYASMFGLDYTQPMDCQVSPEGNMTWQQYFLDRALATWRDYQAMCHDANANGYVLDQEYADYLAQLPDSLAASAVSMGYESAEAMLQVDMGPGATMEGYLNYLNNYYLGYMYYGANMEQFTFTDEEVEAFFDENVEKFQANGVEKSDETYVDVRHILIAPEGGTRDESGTTVYSDAEWAAAESEANDVLNQWLSGEKTEDSFADLAKIHSVDGGSSSNGGLYEDVYVGQMVPEFESWCFDAARQHGDYGIVKTTYGYHIMYFVGSDPVWYVTAQNELMTEKGNEFVQETVDKYPAEINYSAILLGNMDLNAAQ